MSSSSTLSPAAARATLEKVTQKYARLIDVLDYNLLFGAESAFLKSIVMPVARAAIRAAEDVVALAEEDGDAARVAHVTRLTRDIAVSAAATHDINIRDRVARIVKAAADHNGQGVTSMGKNKYTYKVIVGVTESYLTGDLRAADEAMFADRAAAAATKNGSG